jgi:hypothetical protein
MATIKLNNVAVLSSPSGTAPGSPSDGELYYNTATNKLMLYNGSAWVSIIEHSTIGSAVITNQSFDYTGADQGWVAPANVSQIRVSLWGAGGGADSSGGLGGAGGFVSGILSVTPGAAYKIVVGSGGAGDTNDSNHTSEYGGGGGGYEDPGAGGLSGIFSGSGAIFSGAVPQITVGDARHLMIAGGGGGGDPGNPGGRGGGGTNGLDGGKGNGSNAGNGGTTDGSGGSANDGSGFLLGGDGNNRGGSSYRWVGGGGGGFYGGGAGNGGDTTGGGGSSYTGTATNVITEGANVASYTTESTGATPVGTTDGLYHARPDNYIPGQGGTAGTTPASGVGNTHSNGGGWHGTVIISYTLISYA